MRKRISLFATIAFFLFTTGVYGFSGKAEEVLDGDTIKVVHQGRVTIVRLYGIDCPERNQAHSRQAKRFTYSWVFGKTVEIDPMDTDRYGRTVAFVETGGQCLNEELIRAGLAWVYTKYCKSKVCEGWKRLECRARKEGRGLWESKKAVAPWEYRRKGNEANP